MRRYNNKFQVGDYVRHVKQKYSDFSFGAILKVVAVNPTGSIKFDGIWGNGYNPDNFELHQRFSSPSDNLTKDETHLYVAIAVNYFDSNGSTEDLHRWITISHNQPIEIGSHLSNNVGLIIATSYNTIKQKISKNIVNNPTRSWLIFKYHSAGHSVSDPQVEFVGVDDNE